jgi:hypothetical protein
MAYKARQADCLREARAQRLADLAAAARMPQPSRLGALLSRLAAAISNRRQTPESRIQAPASVNGRVRPRAA